MARDHLFHASLRGKVHDWSEFMTNLTQLSDDKIEQLFASLPAPWMTHARKVAQHLTAVRTHAAEFERELNRSLLP